METPASLYNHNCIGNLFSLDSIDSLDTHKLGSIIWGVRKSDVYLSGLAIAILLGGLLMLFNGISAFGDKGK